MTCKMCGGRGYFIKPDLFGECIDREPCGYCDSAQVNQDRRDVIAFTREEAIARVDRNASTDWKDVAYETAVRLARQQQRLLSEDIFDAMPSTVETHEKRAMGAVMRRLNKNAILTPTDEYVMSPSLAGHGRPSRVWRSMVFGRQL